MRTCKLTLLAMIACGVSQLLLPAAAHRADALAVAPSASAVASEALTPFAWDWSRAQESVLDHSRFLAAPAGRDGYVRSVDGHLVQPSGARLRLWGVNLASTSCFPPQDQAPKIAADLARLGFNVARFHHLDADWGECLFRREADDTRTFDAENLDRLDRFIVELQKRGVYVSLTMNVHRRFKPGDGVRDWSLLGIGKGATYFNPRLIELQHEFTRNLLTHRNPYTGREYRHEPALLTIEIVNENSLLEAWVQGRLVGRDDPTGDTWAPIPVSYAHELTEQFNAWLAAGRTPDELAALRAEVGVADDAPIPRLTPSDFAAASPLRFRSEAEFLMQLEERFFAGMRRLIREELGCRSLLFGSADHNDGFAGYAHLASMLQFDVVDGHGYWQHPEIGARTRIKNTPMVNDPLDSTIVQFARTPVAGRPFTISEVNHPFPHAFAAEGYVTLAAYAMFHDWDGVVWFDWERGRLGDPGDGLPPSGWFDLSQDPAKLAQLATAALLWHRRDVATARQTLVRRYTREEIVQAMRLEAWVHRPFFKPGFERSTPLQHATRWALSDGEPRDSEDAEPLSRAAVQPSSIAAVPDRIESDTGQLRWLHADRGRGVVSVTTPRAQALLGFLKGTDESTPQLAVDLENDFAAVALVALDDQPLERSAQLLLTATTGAAVNSGHRIAADGQTLEAWGRGPVLVNPLSGVITLRGLKDAQAVRATPLSAEGAPLPKGFEAAPLGNGWQLRAGDPPTTWWLLEVAR